MEVLIGLGGNLGDPPKVFEAALGELNRGAEVTARSSIYRTAPLGPPQPRYWNMAAVLRWPHSVVELLEQCRHIEDQAGRERDIRWGPRTLDLDLLLIPGLICSGPQLTVPHPHFHERDFTLAPAREIVPSWMHPLRGQTVRDLHDAWLLAKSQVTGREPGLVIASPR